MKSEKMIIDNIRIKQLVSIEETTHELQFRLSAAPKKSTTQVVSGFN